MKAIDRRPSTAKLFTTVAPSSRKPNVNREVVTRAEVLLNWQGSTQVDPDNVIDRLETSAQRTASVTRRSGMEQEGMGKSAIAGRPVDMADLGKRDMRTQFAALCWRRRKDDIEIVVITTRNTGRWVIPKGWPMDGRSPAQSAALEAHEEAGVVGVASERCVGVFTYIKDLPDGGLPVAVAVFPVEVSKLLRTWPESTMRERRWTSLKKAAKMVSDPELSRLLLDPTLPKLLR